MMSPASPLAMAVARVRARIPTGKLPIIIVVGTPTEMRMWLRLNPLAGRCLRQRVVFPQDLTRVRGTDRDAWIVLIMASFMGDDVPADRRRAIMTALEEAGPAVPWLYWSLQERDYQWPS